MFQENLLKTETEEKNTLCFSVEMCYSPTLSARMASVLSRPLADLSLAALESLSA